MNEKAIRCIETILIFLAILSVWPAVFRINNIYSKIGMYVFLIVMVIIFFKRIKRIRTYMKDYSDLKKNKTKHSKKSD